MTVPEFLHETYLRFTREQLLERFAAVPGPGPAGRHATYYDRGIDHWRSRRCHHGGGREVCSTLGHQLEKDERFWAANALMAAFHSPDRVAAFDAVLRSADVAAYEGPAQLGPAEDLQLYFEANLPAPRRYMEALARDLPARAFLPRLVESGTGRARLEGTTKVDALLLAPTTGFAVAFEAKVLSDVSTHTSYDLRRNQMARNLDVLLEPARPGALGSRKPELSCFVLLTPQVFQERPHSRLYGVLREDYRDLARLHEDLPHRSEAELRTVPGRLGWTTWEKVGALVPGSTPWLSGVSCP